MDTNKSIDINVEGLDVIEESIAISEKNVFGVKEKLGKQEVKGSLKIFGKSMVLVIVYLALFTVVLTNKIYTAVVTLICAIPPIIFLVMDALKKNTRKIQQQGHQVDNEYNMIAYMKYVRDTLQLLINNKENLKDMYLQNIENGYYLSFVCPILDENNESTIKAHNIFAESLKFTNEKNYLSIIIEKYDQYAKRYRIVLEIPQDLYSKIIEQQ